jgi:putative hemolysin
MDHLGLQLALVAALVLLNAGFAGSELALISLRESQVRRLAERSETGRVLARLAHEPNRFLATIQIGITLAGFLASATAAVSLGERLAPSLSFLGGGAEPVAIIGTTLALAFVTLVLGELAPKRVAMQHAERWALVAARPLAALERGARPVVWLLSAATDVVVRLVGGDPRAARTAVSQEELEDMVAAHASFTAEQRTIISGALEVGDRMLRTVLVPRRDVVLLDASGPSSAALQHLLECGHSRAPVVRGGPDDIVGIVHVRDLFDGGTVAEHVRPVVALPETVRVVEALRRLQAERQQLAVVIDEHGGFEGIVTVEDLVEEIVGEIYDETDRDLQSVRHEPDGSMVVPGAFPVHDLKDLGVALPSGDYATVAGLVLDRLGRVPDAPGAAVTIGDWRLEVTEVTGHAIARVHLHRRADPTRPGPVRDDEVGVR